MQEIKATVTELRNIFLGSKRLKTTVQFVKDEIKVLIIVTSKNLSFFKKFKASTVDICHLHVPVPNNSMACWTIKLRHCPAVITYYHKLHLHFLHTVF